MYLKNLLMSDILNKIVSKIDKQLKPFQHASVEYVLEQMFVEKRNKVLIADEVGLGKTIIAKGIVVKSMERLQSRNKPFHVVYICSNQTLASQNIKKLNPLDSYPTVLNRLLFLAKMPIEDPNSLLKLSSLTPSTSFSVTNSIGTGEERAIIFALLNQSDVFNDLEEILRLFFRGQMGEQNWENITEEYYLESDAKLRPNLSESFIRKIKNHSFNKKEFTEAYKYIDDASISNLFDALVALLSKLKSEGNTERLYAYSIIRTLRIILTSEVISFLNADLIILDEFQRFNTLLDKNSKTEAGEIAQVVLQEDSNKVLLLSATPFKPYTTNIEQLNGENHHEEFKKIITFLGGTKGEELWNDFKRDQNAFFDILRHPKVISENIKESIGVKNKLETTFKKFISRNERLNLASNYETMIHSNKDSKIDLIKDDIVNFVAFDRLVNEIKELEESSNVHIGSTLEFAKSAPYPLSYLHGYKLKEEVDKYIVDSKSLIKKNKSAWLSLDKINNYKSVGYNTDGEATYPNGKIRMLANECFKYNSELLLWVPPSEPYYKPFGAFENVDDFSKILVFSSWVMAPRAISTLLSYEVERRTIAKENLDDIQENEVRNYFVEEKKQRRPRPILTFKSSEKNEFSSMSSFILSYPSKALTSILEFNKLQGNDISYDKLITYVSNQVKELFETNGLDRFVDSSKSKIDKRWYWVVSPLLDYLQDKNFDTINKIISVTENDNSEEDKKDSSKVKHLRHLKDVVEQIKLGELLLGTMPDDLHDVLAESALSSPANASLLALGKCKSFKNDIRIYQSSFEIADLFRKMFDKPESISAIRISSEGKEYWRKVLNYCASGNILSMLEEYIYLIVKGDNIETLPRIVDVFGEILNLNTSNVDVDFNNKNEKIETHKMRSHFAVSYGTTHTTSVKGSQRNSNIRTVFNSPFRPFVLSSTSIGQEGLDFHYYCRKIFHWNLPHNAIDLEQREGRINRFNGLVIRKKIAEELDVDFDRVQDENIWKILLDKAESHSQEDKTGVMPYWFFEGGSATIERFVPIHEYSKDNSQYEQIKTILALYRLTFGQPRQEELIEAFKDSGLSEGDIKNIREKLLINLSPIKGR